MTEVQIKVGDRVSIYDMGPSRVIEIINGNECTIRGEGINGHVAVRVWTRLLKRM
jgi:hypothetical protein